MTGPAVERPDQLAEHDAVRGNQCRPCVEGAHCRHVNECGCTVCEPRAEGDAT